MAKVHVVGAGPAGSIAAISAVRCGHDVIVSEEHLTSGLPENCSGLFSKDGLESLKDFIDYRRFIIRPIHGADMHLVDQKLTIRRPDAAGFVCDRAAMDAALTVRAENEGARIIYGERITGGRIERTSVNDICGIPSTSQTSSNLRLCGDFHADNIIGADGPLSSVARFFHFPRISRYVSTLQAEVKYRSEDPNAVEVFLSNKLFPGFFGWVIPHTEYTAEFGVGVLLPHRAKDAWNKFLKLKGISGDSGAIQDLGSGGHGNHGFRGVRGAIIPVSVRGKTGMRRGKRNILLTGDAAGQVKSTTGGGVIFGGNCAALAGRYPTNPLRYELEWRARYGLDLSIHSALHNFLSNTSDSGLLALGRRLKKLNFDSYLSDYGHMDRPTKMLRPQLAAHLLKNMFGVS